MASACHQRHANGVPPRRGPQEVESVPEWLQSASSSRRIQRVLTRASEYKNTSCQQFSLVLLQFHRIICSRKGDPLCPRAAFTIYPFQTFPFALLIVTITTISLSLWVFSMVSRIPKVITYG